MEDILAQGFERNLVRDATIADSLDQAKMFWRIRELFGEVQRHEGGSIKHDVSVPVAAVPAFIREASEAVVKQIADAHAQPVGHRGDDNIQDCETQHVGADKEEYLEHWHDLNAVV